MSTAARNRWTVCALGASLGVLAAIALHLGALEAVVMTAVVQGLAGFLWYEHGGFD